MPGKDTHGYANALTVVRTESPPRPDKGHMDRHESSADERREDTIYVEIGAPIVNAHDSYNKNSPSFTHLQSIIQIGDGTTYVILFSKHFHILLLIERSHQRLDVNKVFGQ